MDSWFAGFTDGEGCFFIEKKRGGHSYSPQFSVTLRADDGALFYELQKEFGGVVRFRMPTDSPGWISGANPQFSWRVSSKKDVLGLIEYFDKYPPRGKKKNEYPVWREAAMLYYRHSQGSGGCVGNPQWLVDVMEEHRLELKRLKKYEAQPRDLLEPPEDPQLFLLGEVVDEAVGGGQ